MREADFSSNPVGSGPFAVKRVQTSESTKVVLTWCGWNRILNITEQFRLCRKAQMRAYGNESLLVKAVNSGDGRLRVCLCRLLITLNLNSTRLNIGFQQRRLSFDE